MKTNGEKRFCWVGLIGTFLLWCLGVVPATANGATPEPMEWTIDGVRREAVVFAPPGKGPAPVVFAFHGHGGNLRSAGRSFQIHTLWPEAVVVYMQGLPTPGKTDPEGKKPGWQKKRGDQGDRDLRFFDAVLETLKKKYPVNQKQVFAMGHSNGGRFTYLLWAERASVFAGFAPSGSPGLSFTSLAPKPVLHIAGKKDPLVPFAGQEWTMENVRKVNDCAAEGKPWAQFATFYPSSKNAPVVTVIHPGGHQYPDFAPALIVRFFKEVIAGQGGVMRK